MKKVYLLILFIVINFGGLALGYYLMNNGPNSIWYKSLNQAPWTPPNWVFSWAWTLIMICFSLYLSYLFSLRKSAHLIIVFSIAFILNVSWNFLFFNQHLTMVALVNIIALTLLIIYFYISFGDEKLSKLKYLLLPYILWLCIATSLNAYIVFYN
ncbi:TspO/MBR family protein [Winogradskyella sp. PE311]|uniref:TspO/MBR family protein n=1 Tax=Winogradskyella sp. PE311 TaxID=3366943 RepID=UPI003980A273